MAVPVIMLVLIVASVVVLALVIWSIKRHRNPDLNIECDSPIDELLPSLAGLSLGTAVDGNTVEVIENGAYFDVLLEEIRAAKRSVHFENYLWKEGVLGQRVADALSERSRAGVQVRVLLDATGTRKMGEAIERQLEESGCKLVKFHSWHIHNIGVMNARDHRKLAVIDGRVGFVGGHCIVDAWLGDAQDSEHFADISVRLRGPIVPTPARPSRRSRPLRCSTRSKRPLPCAMPSRRSTCSGSPIGRRSSGRRCQRGGACRRSMCTTVSAGHLASRCDRSARHWD